MTWMDLNSIMLSEMLDGETLIPYDPTYRKNQESSKPWTFCLPGAQGIETQSFCSVGIGFY